jgi:integrase
MLAISNYQSTPAVKAALQLSALLFQRPGEIRAMLWADIDWEAGEWRYLVTKSKRSPNHTLDASGIVNFLQHFQTLPTVICLPDI